MRTLDRIFGWLLVVASLALLPFSHAAYRGDLFPLSLGLCLCGLLLGAMNLMRAERPHDRTLARVCLAGNAVLAVLMGMVTLATLRPVAPLTVAAVSIVLLPLSLRTRRRSRPM